MSLEPIATGNTGGGSGMKVTGYWSADAQINVDGSNESSSVTSTLNL